jgi:hypothetical protein
MATFTNQTKSAGTFSNQTKNSGVFTNQSKPGEITYLLTDALDYVLVGSAEDLTLITSAGTDWTNLVKT